jgi:hypothetical protein
MNTLASVLFAVTFALAGSPASAAIELSEDVHYLPGAVALEGCGWEQGMVQTSVAKSRSFVIAAGRPGALPAPRMALEVIQLKWIPGPKTTEYVIVVRVNLTESGKLVATREFQEDGSFASGKPACDALHATGASLGESVAAWTARTKFIKCDDGCDGIHPDEPIVTGATVLIGEADAINDTVRVDCRFPTAMVAMLVKSFNEYDPTPRAKLESRAIDIEQYVGRRLVLRVNNVHALGGGGWTGPKWMDMSGELWDGRIKVGSFESHVTGGMGFTTCRSVDSLSGSTADAIVEWLRSPSLDAHLN